MEILYEEKSINGQRLKVYEDGIVLLERGMKSDDLTPEYRTFFYDEILAVDFKNCGWFKGSMEFKIKGSSKRLKELNAGKASSTVFEFSKTSLPENRILAQKMEKINMFIQLKIEEAQANKVQPGTVVSVADEIIKFKQLLDQGILTQEEFDKKKKELLG
ncbi:MAG: SHOCT domain-containing protein [Erysipelotrichaceae bacterium]